MPCRRCFYQWDKRKRDATDDHIGTHPIVLQQVARRHEAFEEHLRQTARAIQGALAVAASPSAAVACPSIVLACFCRAGEKRSVSLATLLHHCLRASVPGVVVREPEHLSEWYWWRTCKGMCPLCQKGGPQHKLEAESVLEQARVRFQEIWQQER